MSMLHTNIEMKLVSFAQFLYAITYAHKYTQ